MYMFCANRGSGPSMDCLAQTVDRALSGQTVDRLRKAWMWDKLWIATARHIRARMRARRLM